MQYAVIESGGKQHRVSVGMTLDVDNLSAENDKEVSFDKVLLVVDGEAIEIGKPYLPGVMVTGKVLTTFKGKKIRVARFTAKSRHRKTMGSRALLSKVQIEGIVKNSKKESAAATPKKASKKE